MNKKTLLMTTVLMSTLVMALASAQTHGYNDNLYNSCFTSMYSLFLCPFNVIRLLAEVLDLVAFIIVWRQTKSPAIAFLGSAIVSYLLVILYFHFGATLQSASLSLGISLILTVSWIAAFAYEINK